VLFRRMLAQAIREVQEGNKPGVPRLYPQGPVRTYASEIVVRAPEGVLDDPQALAAFGQKAALAFVETDHLLGPERETATADKVQALLREFSPAGAK